MLHMCKKPVNTLNLDMLTELTTALDQLESSHQCNALIITSVCVHCLSYCMRPTKVSRCFRHLTVLHYYSSKKQVSKQVNGLYSLSAEVKTHRHDLPSDDNLPIMLPVSD